MGKGARRPRQRALRHIIVCPDCGAVKRFNYYAHYPVGPFAYQCQEHKPKWYLIPECNGVTWIVGHHQKMTDEEARAMLKLITSAGNHG